jgi:hypothetical protein
MPERQRRRHRALSSFIVEQDLQSSACILCDGRLAIRAERSKDDTISIPVGVGSAARRARSTSSGEILLWDLLSSLRSMSSSSLRFIERMIALSEVDFKPSMAAEASRDTITCTHQTVRARCRCPLRRALQRELPSSGSGANSRQ